MILCAHGQNQYYCSQCNPMNLESLDTIDPKLFAPAPPVKTWKEQFPSGTKSVTEQVTAEKQEEILHNQSAEYFHAAGLDDIPFGMRKERE